MAISTIANLLKGVSVEQILQYYAILCLVFMPINIICIIILNKKTDFLKKIDAAIDRMLGIPTEKPKMDKKPQSDKPKPEQAESNGQVEMPGVSEFSILINKRYICRQVNDERNGNEIEWFTDNEFIGEITNKNIFVGKKAGNVKVYCQRKNDDFDTGTIVYSIDVKPEHVKWIAEDYLLRVSSKIKRDVLLGSMMSSHIAENNLEKRILSYDGIAGLKKVVYQFDKKEQLQRCVLFLADEKSMDEIISSVSERMEELVLSGNSGQIRTRVWVYRKMNQYEDAIVYYCILKGKTLSFCQNWREMGDSEEFIENISQAEAMLDDCIPGNIPEEYSAAFKKRNGKKSTVRTGVSNVLDNPAELTSEVEQKEKVEENVEEQSLTDDESTQTEESDNEQVASSDDKPDEMQDVDDEKTDGSEDSDETEIPENSSEDVDFSEADEAATRDYDSYQDYD